MLLEPHVKLVTLTRRQNSAFGHRWYGILMVDFTLESVEFLVWLNELETLESDFGLRLEGC